jgi:N-acetylneuraminate synthase
MNIRKYPYVIAETAYSFEGDGEYLLEQTQRLPKEVNAIKYHMLYNITEYMDEKHSVFPLLKSWIISEEQWTRILKCAKEMKHDIIVLADDTSTVDYLEKHLDLVDGIEIHAACINDKDLFDRIINFANKYKKYMFIGISGFEIVELFDIIQYLKEKQCTNVILMYGFQNYPTKVSDVQLDKIPKLKELLGFEVGYADHTGYDESFKEQMIKTAYTLGAKIQEIHYVLNEGEKRTDSVTAVSAERLKKIYEELVLVDQAIGKCDLRLNEGEIKYLNFRKVVSYSKKLKSGHVITQDDIRFIRIENPIGQHHFSEELEYIGKTLAVDVVENQEIQMEDFKE